MKTPRPHQQQIISNGVDYFAENNRGKLIMPCGSGKTLSSLWLAKALKSQHIIIAFPNLSLESQTVEVWLNDIKDAGLNYHILVLGSDKKIGLLHNVDVTTNADEVELFLRNNVQNRTIIFTTYQSSHLIGKVASDLNYVFDLAIFDEAHHTSGSEKALFQQLLFTNNYIIRKRLFMTATPKVLIGRGDNQHVKSMDDESIYGKTFYSLSIPDAISQGIISDYKVVTLFSADEEIRNWITENALLNDTNNTINPSEIRMVATAISLCKSILKYDLKRIISYHRNIQKAKEFQVLFKKVSAFFGINIAIYHLNGTDNAEKRESVVGDFTNAPIGLLTNSRLLNEGFDIPSVDAVCFADERSSATDIVQAAGRAWRKSEGKKFGYILIPCVVGENTLIDSDELLSLRKTLATLAGQDSQVIASFRNSAKTGRIIQSRNVLFESFNINFSFEDLANLVSEKVWTNVKSLYYMSYEDAKKWFKENMLDTGIDTITKWRDYCDGKYPDLMPKPLEIPRNLRFYQGQGYTGIGDFLDTDFSFLAQKEWVKQNLMPLGIDKQKAWFAYLKEEIPNAPKLPRGHLRHPASSKEWVNWHDWFGRESPDFWDYETTKKWFHEHLIPKGIDTRTKVEKYLTGKLDNQSELPERPKFLKKDFSNIIKGKSLSDFFNKDTYAE